MPWAGWQLDACSSLVREECLSSACALNEIGHLYMLATRPLARQQFHDSLGRRIGEGYQTGHADL